MFENLQEGIKYAVRLRNRGPRTLNGDGGVAKVKGPDGTTFTFSACSLSSNGTNHNRGQIPQVLYYRYVMFHIFIFVRVQDAYCLCMSRPPYGQMQSMSRSPQGRINGMAKATSQSFTPRHVQLMHDVTIVLAVHHRKERISYKTTRLWRSIRPEKTL